MIQHLRLGAAPIWGLASTLHVNREGAVNFFDNKHGATVKLCLPLLHVPCLEARSLPVRLQCKVTLQDAAADGQPLLDLKLRVHVGHIEWKVSGNRRPDLSGFPRLSNGCADEASKIEIKPQHAFPQQDGAKWNQENEETHLKSWMLLLTPQTWAEAQVRGRTARRPRSTALSRMREACIMPDMPCTAACQAV